MKVYVEITIGLCVEAEDTTHAGYVAHERLQAGLKSEEYEEVGCDAWPEEGQND